MKRPIITTLLFSAALLMPSCGGARIKVTATLPATKIDLARQNVKRLALGDVKDSVGDPSAAELLGGELREQLVSLNSRFDILDRSAVDKLVQEHQLNASGMVAQETAAAAGCFKGAAALILASLLQHHCKGDVRRESFKAGDGTVHTRAQRTVTGMVQATFQVIDVETGKLMAVQKCEQTDRVVSPSSRGYSIFSGKEEIREEWCVDTEPPNIDPSALLSELRRRVVEQFVRSIAPYQFVYELDLTSDSDLPTLEQGNNAVRINEWAQALSLYEQALKATEAPDKAKLAPKVLFNIGIAKRQLGDFAGALATLKKAYMLDNRKEYQVEVERTQRFAAGAAQN